MKMFLFMMDLKVFLALSLLYLFIIPLILFIKKRKLSLYLYLVTYLLILFLGVFSDVKLTYQSISFSLLLTPHFFNNSWFIASFEPLGIIINIFLLFPIGFLYPCFSFKKHLFIKVIFLSFLISLSIETLQYILPIVRYPELLDILTNTISGILGYGYYLILSKIKGSGKNDWLPKQKENH